MNDSPPKAGSTSTCKRCGGFQEGEREGSRPSRRASAEPSLTAGYERNALGLVPPHLRRMEQCQDSIRRSPAARVADPGSSDAQLWAGVRSDSPGRVQGSGGPRHTRRFARPGPTRPADEVSRAALIRESLCSVSGAGVPLRSEPLTERRERPVIELAGVECCKLDKYG